MLIVNCKIALRRLRLLAARFPQPLSLSTTSVLRCVLCTLTAVNGAWAQPASTSSGQAASTGSAQTASTGSGQTYPAKPVRIIVPFAPGANADLIGRIVAQRVSPMWGQPVLLDNRPGGSAEDFARFIRSEITKYAKVVKAAGIRGE